MDYFKYEYDKNKLVKLSNQNCIVELVTDNLDLKIVINNFQISLAFNGKDKISLPSSYQIIKLKKERFLVIPENAKKVKEKQLIQNKNIIVLEYRNSGVLQFFTVFNKKTGKVEDPVLIRAEKVIALKENGEIFFPCYVYRTEDKYQFVFGLDEKIYKVVKYRPINVSTFIAGGIVYTRKATNS